MDMTFDRVYYRIQNTDVNDAIKKGIFASAYDHYVAFGVQEGRLPNQEAFSNWNEQDYLFLHKDVADAVAKGIFKNGFEHYYHHGQYENRPVNISGAIENIPSEPFDESFYLLQNPDVLSAVLEGVFFSGQEHYIMIGEEEGRMPVASISDNLAYDYI